MEEMLATLLERQDTWSRAMLHAQMGHKEISMPGEIHIPRPGDEAAEQDKPRVETDPAAIAAFFAQSVGR